MIPLQNGIDAHERLIPILGREAVMCGVAQISASITAPGVITQVGTFMRMIFGELDGKRSRRAEDFLALCLKAGFAATLSEADHHRALDEVHPARHQCRHDGAGAPADGPAARRSRYQPATSPPACQETASVARAKGIALPSDALEKVLDLVGHMPPDMKASMALDLERGNRLELPWLSGKVAELGRELGVPTPTHSMIYAMLKPYVMGRKG